MRFSKIFRLQNKGHFAFVLRENHRLMGKAIIIKYRSGHLKGPKMGISVSKKYGNAIKRNHFKRIVREQYRKILDQIDEEIQFIVSPKTKEEMIDLTLIKQDFIDFAKHLKSKKLLAALL